MISAVVTERLAKGEGCRLEAGTLRLRRCREGEEAVFTTTDVLPLGSEVWIVPMDGLLVAASSGVRVPGSYTQRHGPGGVVSSPGGEG